MYALHALTSFFASAAFGILFNVPRRTLLHCGIIGMAGWLTYYTLVHVPVDATLATLAASAVVSVISQACARLFKTPVIVFSVSGIIPLVPGGLAYDAMRNVVENHYGAAVQLAAKAFMLSGAIAMGLVLSEVFNQVTQRRTNV